MGGTYAIKMGDRGRLVIPVELRAELGLEAGSPLILINTPDGVLLTTRAQALQRSREELQGPSLVDELIADRRSEAARDNTITS